MTTFDGEGQQLRYGSWIWPKLLFSEFLTQITYDIYDFYKQFLSLMATYTPQQVPFVAHIRSEKRENNIKAT